MTALILSCIGFSFATSPVPILTVADSINPGTADYIVTNIHAAENEQAPFLLIELDTPGGLLGSTRQIVQAMLNATIPIVVYVGPKGAHAGSAGAIIALAADVTAMAPGTNMGAAHPVVPGGEKLDSVMNEKMTNDTAAFAESVAKAKHRNQVWAVKAVKNSESIISDVALREGVIDLIGENTEALLAELSRFKLRVPKNDATLLPVVTSSKRVPMSIKHRLISFFADPNLAYMIMSLGGLCIWIELSHPGLIFPGVLGTICILLSLISFQMMPIHYGALGFVILGMALVIAEAFLPTYGLLGVAGIVSFVLGSIYLMDTSVPEFQLAPSLIFSTAVTLAAVATVLGYLVLKARKARPRSGVEALIGELAEVKEAIGKQGGKVFVQGELWSALSDSGLDIPQGSTVRISAVQNLSLVVSPVG